MMLSYRPLIFALFLFGANFLVFANTANSANLSWQEAVQYSLEKNPEIQAAKRNVETAQAKKKVAFSGFLPSLRASLGYEDTERSGTTGVPVITGTGWTAGLQGSLNLFSGFSDYYKYEQAKADLESSISAFRQTKARISQELKTAFEANVFAREFSILSSQILKRRGDNLKLVRLRFQSGRENKGSVLLSEAYLNQAQYDDLQAKNSITTSNAALGKLLGYDEKDFATISTSGNVPTNNVTTDQKPDLNRLSRETPDYLIAQAQAKSLELAKNIARSSFFPTLDLSAGINQRGSDFFPDTSSTKSFGITLSLPIFTGGKNLYGFEQAAAAAAGSALQAENTLREQRRKLEAAWNTYGESILKLKADESFHKAAMIRAEIARTRYNNGLLTFDDWDIIENDLIARERAYLNTKRDRVTAEASWEQAQGRGAL